MLVGFISLAMAMALLCCKRQSPKSGQEPFMSSSGLHRLHIFIFILAAVHVFYSFVTMLLALLKVHSWKKWEREVQQAAQNLNLDDIVNSITFTRKSSFQKYHASMCCSSNTIVVWVVSSDNDGAEARTDATAAALCCWSRYSSPRWELLAAGPAISADSICTSYEFCSCDQHECN
ncbi:hypothetical protein M758_N005800 [Ceratodon purpureus]|nr:hypothetical protein M758_N005800 [Ceratodon purpureus]